MFSFITTLLFWVIWSLGFFLYIFLAIFSWWNSTYVDIFYSVKLKLSYRHETWYLNHLMGLATVNCLTSVISFQRKIVFLTLFFWYSGNLALFPGGLKWLQEPLILACIWGRVWWNIFFLVHSVSVTLFPTSESGSIFPSFFGK